MKKIVNLLLFVFVSATLTAQPVGYYNTALGKNGSALQTELKNIIDNHTILSFPLWNSFGVADNKGGNILWDIYSDIPGGTPSYTYTIGSDQCGQYNSEGDCYNHEHIWPKTYFNDVVPMTNDLHHLLPTDGWVNNKRSNFPVGEVTNTAWTGTNGSKTGTSNSYAGYNGNVFEPIDAYKGDVARIYFYMSTRYRGEDNAWQSWEMANGSVLSSDAIQLLLQWHQNDTVSQKEIDRNNVVYALQGNRNPFVDYPIFADCIWGTADCTPLTVDNFLMRQIQLAPNPSSDVLNVILPDAFRSKSVLFEIYNTIGQRVVVSAESKITIANLPMGIYSLRVLVEDQNATFSFLKK